MTELGDLAALRLMMEWGADEALDEAPVDRFRPVPALSTPQALPIAAPVVQAARPGATSLDALHAELLAFEGCILKQTAMHTVQPDGNPDAGLVLIGDAPGPDDDRSGRAFSGPPGALLDRVLRPLGLDRTGMLLAPLVPWRPPGSRKLSEAEVEACLPFLHRLLLLTRPRHLVLLGTGPVRALAGNSEPVRRLRGRWLDVIVPGLDAPIPALPLPQLDQWLRSPAAKRGLWSDLLQLRVATRSA